MTKKNPDPDKTREIRAARAKPALEVGGSPAAGPTREIHSPLSRKPVPDSPLNRGEPAPWWQTINQDRRQPPIEVREQLAQGLIDSDPKAVRPAETERAQSPKSSTRLLTYGGLAFAVAAAASAGLLIGKGTGSPGRVLDLTSAQQGVAQVLQDPVAGYGITSVTNIICNDGISPRVQTGRSFTCEVVVDGAPSHVAVVFQDDAGTYAVDRPR